MESIPPPQHPASEKLQYSAGSASHSRSDAPDPSGDSASGWTESTSTGPRYNLPTPAKGQVYVVPAGTAVELDSVGAPGEVRKTEGLRLRGSASIFQRVSAPALVILIPIAFLYIAVAVGRLNNTSESSFGANILTVVSLSSTLWPLAFAAVAGQMLRSIALFKAEKGTTIGSIEVLLTSQTLGTTLVSILSIRTFGVVVIALLAIWAWSPLGGQAVLRSISLVPNKETSSFEAKYYLGNFSANSGLGTTVNNDPGAMGPIVFNSYADDMRRDIAVMRSAVTSSFFTPDVVLIHANTSSVLFHDSIQSLGGNRTALSRSERDAWGNVRVPFIEELPGYDPKLPFDWVDTKADLIPPYSALIGVPIRGIPLNKTGNSTIDVRSSYQTLSCQPWFDGEKWLNQTSEKLYFHPNASADWGELKRFTPDYENLFDTSAFTAHGFWRNIYLDLINDTALQGHKFLESPWDYPKVEPEGKLRLFFGTSCIKDTTVCSISTTYVEMTVDCTRFAMENDLACRASRIRHTPGLPLSGNLTPISTKQSRILLQEVPVTLSKVYGTGRLERYLMDPSMTGRVIETYELDEFCLHSLPMYIFELRLGLALNTFIRAAYNSTILTGADGNFLEDRDGRWTETTGNWTEPIGNFYSIDRAWYAVYLVATAILMLCALTNLILCLGTNSPDVLGTVVGLIRDSKYVSVGDENTSRSARESLTAIRNHRVKMSDVLPESEDGYVTLTDQLDGRNVRMRTYQWSE